MTAVASPASAAPIRVAAGTTAGAAVRDAGYPVAGPPTRWSSCGTPKVGCAICPGYPRPTRTSRPSPPTPRTAEASSGTRPRTCWHKRVQSLFPEAKLGIGPPITDGFYYGLRRAAGVHPGRPCRAGEAHASDRQGRPAVRSAGSTSRRIRRARTSPTNPSSWSWSTTSRVTPRSWRSVGDELTAYDNLNPRTRERIWGDLCRGPAHPDHQVHSRPSS